MFSPDHLVGSVKSSYVHEIFKQQFVVGFKIINIHLEFQIKISSSLKTVKSIKEKKKERKHIWNIKTIHNPQPHANS